MKVLITAGSTEVPIDKVRCISNIFKGKTGWKIAKQFVELGADVTLITSFDHRSPEEKKSFARPTTKYSHIAYRTFDDLHGILESETVCAQITDPYDVIIHSAAISDYYVSGTFIQQNGQMAPVDASKKISSAHQKLYLELSPTIKLVDQIRQPWGFEGKLVKFKLQVGISDEELLDIAKKSLKTSVADYIVANCLEWHHDRAYIVSAKGEVLNVKRDELPKQLFTLLSLK